MTQATAYQHIIINQAGVATIEGTTTKVIEIVLDMQAHGWSPEEIHFQHPHLTLGQIHSALAYYWDNKPQLDREISERLERADHLRRTAPPSRFIERMKAKGLL